jgi:hypothetical protein
MRYLGEPTLAPMRSSTALLATVIATDFDRAERIERDLGSVPAR